MSHHDSIKTRVNQGCRESLTNAFKFALLAMSRTTTPLPGLVSPVNITIRGVNKTSGIFPDNEFEVYTRGHQSAHQYTQQLSKFVARRLRKLWALMCEQLPNLTLLEITVDFKGESFILWYYSANEEQNGEVTFAFSNRPATPKRCA